MDILTPEQKAEVQKRLDEMKKKMEGKKKKSDA